MKEMLEGRYAGARMVAVEDDMRPLLTIQCHAALVHQVDAWGDWPDGLGIGWGDGQLIWLMVRSPLAQAIIIGLSVPRVDVVDTLFLAQGIRQTQLRRYSRITTKLWGYA